MKKYRNEWKYICNNLDIELINKRLSAVMEYDKHSSNGKYIVHSLYFDNYKNKCSRENDAGISRRYKWRIRYYGDDINTLHLERKEKVNGMCYKDSCKLSIKEYKMIQNNDISLLMWNASNKLIQELCIDMMDKLFKPKIIVDYERIAYVEEISNIRITLDTNITSSFDVDNFLNKEYLEYSQLENNRHVLEVKFDDVLPGHIKNIINTNKLDRSSYSKFYIGMKQIDGVLK